VQNIPHLNTLAEAYHDKGVRFISISDESRDIIERFLRVRPIKGWVALDPDRSMFDTFCKGISIPQTFIVDGQGVLVAGPLTPNELTKDMLGAILAGKQLPPTPSPSPEPAVSVTEPETFPPSPLDASAAFQLVIGSANGEGSYMEWSTGVYVNTSVDVETLLTRLYNLRTPLSIRWEVTPPDHPLRFVGKMPDQREELFHRIAVPALEAYLGLSITRESVQADVYVLTAPDGPGPNLTKAAKSNVTSHRFHHVSIEGLLFASDNDFGWLVQSLEKVLGRPIVEETGFQGRWNWGLEFEPGDVESLRRSAREQLGLVLTPERREIEMVVVRKAASAGEQERSK
jgi:hypothetical protein